MRRLESSIEMERSDTTKDFIKSKENILQENRLKVNGMIQIQENLLKFNCFGSINMIKTNGKSKMRVEVLNAKIL